MYRFYISLPNSTTTESGAHGGIADGKDVGDGDDDGGDHRPDAVHADRFLG